MTAHYNITQRTTLGLDPHISALELGPYKTTLGLDPHISALELGPCKTTLGLDPHKSALYRIGSSQNGIRIWSTQDSRHTKLIDKECT